jgi:hypothetical protein
MMGKQTSKYRIEEMVIAAGVYILSLQGKPQKKAQLAEAVVKELHRNRARKWTIEQDAKFFLRNWTYIKRILRLGNIFLIPQGKMGVKQVTEEEFLVFKENYLTSWCTTYNKTVDIIRAHGGEALYLALAHDKDLRGFTVVEVDWNLYSEEDDNG